MKALLPLAILLFACTPEAPRPQLDAQLDARLDARLVTPTDIALRWKGAADPDGWAVEFATEPRGRYTTLGFLPAGQRSYHHPELIPRTTFYYRVRPYTAEPVRDTTAKAVGERIRFAWNDTVRGEDGFLIWARDRPVAYVRPDHESFTLHTVPGERPSGFRIRAFHYGEPSNLVQLKTGDPRS